jgi:hypothetical protein
MKKTSNNGLNTARLAKKDEFYTSLSDIELELKHYTDHFKGKVVYCNCDDPRESNFFRYFAVNFKKLGLKKLIATCYKSQEVILFDRSESSQQAVYVEYVCGKNNSSNEDIEDFDIKPLVGNGDFRSAECVEFLKQADVVVTNPPFSLFREYVAQLIKYEKKFLIIGNMNAVTYNEIFPLFQNNKMWYGPSIRSGDREFRVPDNYPVTASGSRVDEYGNKYVKVKGVRWFTNLEYSDRLKSLDIQKTFCPDAYPKYANFDAIEVSKTKDIPLNYYGPMGVPISFLDKYSPLQFDILGSSKTLGKSMSKIAKKGSYQQGGPRFYLPNSDGHYRRLYDRIVIRNKNADGNYCKKPEV